MCVRSRVPSVQALWTATRSGPKPGMLTPSRSSVGREPKIRSGFGRHAVAVLGDGLDEGVDLGVFGVVEEGSIGGVGEEGRLSGHLELDGGDDVLADAERVIATEGKLRALAVKTSVGRDHRSGEARYLDRLGVAVLVGAAVHDPRLIELRP